jgi:tetratricopeptide (TPR) repeat protein
MTLNLAAPLSSVQIKPLFPEVFSKTQENRETSSNPIQRLDYLKSFPFRIKPSPDKEFLDIFRKAELTREFLRKEKDNFSLSKTFEMCCLLVARNMKDRAISLFKIHALKFFVKDPHEFTKQLLDCTQEAGENLNQSAKINPPVLRNLLQIALIESKFQDLLSRTPPSLFSWIQNDEPGNQELFRGYEQQTYSNYCEALNYYKEAAALGNSHALVKMGNYYYVGHGVAGKDCIQAFKYYEEAAALGNSRALLEMGKCYAMENGIPNIRNWGKALECYKQAATLGDPDAFVKIGDCYLNDRGVFTQGDAEAF